MSESKSWNQVKLEEVSRLGAIIEDMKSELLHVAQKATEEACARMPCGHPLACQNEDMKGLYCEWCQDKTKLIDWCDLMVDEFKRIRSCPGVDDEIKGLCDRAIKNTIQHVPVIEQRDDAESRLSTAMARAETAKAKLGEAEKTIDANFNHVSFMRLHERQGDALRTAEAQRNEACQHIRWMLPLNPPYDEESGIDADARAFVARLASGGGKPDPIPPGCFDCGLVYGDDGFPDLVIPNDVWNIISPTGDGGGLLCPNCICRRLVRHGIETPGKFRSGPLCIDDPVPDPRMALTAMDLQAALQWRSFVGPENGWFFYPETFKKLESIISALEPADGAKENPNE